MTTTPDITRYTGDEGRDRMRNPSSNAPHSREEALAAVIDNVTRDVLRNCFMLNHEAEVGGVTGRTQTQADWLNEARVQVRTALTLGMSIIDPRVRRETDPTIVEKAAQRVRDERAWIEEHGGNEAGYVIRYGSRVDPDCYGNGGEAIYAADVAALERAQATYDALFAEDGR
jgi:hypothetical protein